MRFLGWERCFLIILLGILPLTGFADCKSAANITLQVLGSGGPEINDQRASSGYLLWQGNRAVVMIDTGSGTALNYENSGADLNDLQAVLFTHFHVDHSVDFPTLIKASYFTDRSNDLLVIGPAENTVMPSTNDFITTLLGGTGAYRYLDEYVTAEIKSDYKLKIVEVPLVPRGLFQYSINDSIRLSAIPVHHGPIAAIAWRVDIDGCAITFSGDMSNSYNTLTELAINSDVLVASNAIPEGASGIARFLHMPPSEIGKIAAQAQVKQLLLSHRMLRTQGREAETKTYIRLNYAGPITFANDLDRIATGDTEAP